MRNFRKLSKRTILFVVSLIALTYVSNALLIGLSSPGNSQIAAKVTTVEKIGNMDILSYDNLKSGGVGIFGWNVEASGYVNMLSPEPVIYVNSDHSESFVQSRYLYKHEYAHVLQKEMIAHKSGGYPSISNPWQSIKYYSNLVKLNQVLKDSMPEINHESKAWKLTEGFEAAAECYAQPRSSIKDDPVYYNASYLNDGHCSAEQVRLAITLINSDEWFDPILPIEKLKTIEKENITNVLPKIAKVPDVVVPED